MPKKPGRASADTVPRKGSVKSVVGKTMSGKREIWHVTTATAQHKLVTSVGSANTMDEAVKVLGPALRRLAHR